MIYLGLICAINVFVGYVFIDIPLEAIAYIDSAIKLVFGIYLLFFQSHQKRHLENEVPIQQRLQITTIAQPSYYFFKSIAQASSLSHLRFILICISSNC